MTYGILLKTSMFRKELINTYSICCLSIGNLIWHRNISSLFHFVQFIISQLVLIALLSNK